MFVGLVDEYTRISARICDWLPTVFAYRCRRGHMHVCIFSFSYFASELTG